ncbi:MAG TPA: RNA polymerase sigma factor [Streptosporangiaceae bacterium]
MSIEVATTDPVMDPATTDPDLADEDLADEPELAGFSELVLRAQRGDSDAFRALYRDTQPRILRYLRALVADEAEDIASETWLQVARDLKTFHGDDDHFRGWVSTIARHRALDHKRTASRRLHTIAVPIEDLVGLAASDDTATCAIDAVATTSALRLIATLPHDQAEAVLLRAVVGLQATTAAEVLGKRPGAVRTAAYRGLRTLARYFEEE